MAKIFPFRGYRYNQERIKDISRVITEPYDKITPKMQEDYYNRHPYNIVRIIKGETGPGDSGRDNQYTRAREYLDRWLKDGILKRDEDEAIYVYTEEYGIGGGLPKTRRSFIALGELEEFGKGGVKPHERTLAGPKADRLNLTRATATQFGLIFMLYSDPDQEINSTLAGCCEGAPDIEARDDNGVIHRVWVVKDRSVIQKVTHPMKDRLLFIADGHHRYETALNYKRELEEEGVECTPGNENYDNQMMAYVAMEDRGLTILPTHRLIFNLSAEQLESFPKKMEEFCEVIPCGSLDELLEKMKMEEPGDHRFGLYLNGNYRMLRVRDGKKASEIVSVEGSAEYRSLDVTLIHALLEHILGIGREKLERETNVAYERYSRDSVRMVDEGKYQMAIFLNPTKAWQVARIAGRGERMPQKSTDFYPKLYTGLVINRLNIIPS